MVPCILKPEGDMRAKPTMLASANVVLIRKEQRQWLSVLAGSTRHKLAWLQNM